MKPLSRTTHTETQPCNHEPDVIYLESEGLKLVSLVRIRYA